MPTYILPGLCLLLLAISVLCVYGVWKAVKIREYEEKQRYYLEKALKARGLWDEYRLAVRDSLELWGRDEPAVKR